jgi:membrane-associated phospholipid phosphatase
MIAVMAAGLGPGLAALILWIWAPLVALARVAMGVHYVSDVVAGFLVGILMGLFVIQIHQVFLMWLGTFIHFPLW